MRRLCPGHALIVLGLLSLPATGSAAKWLKLESEHFELYSSAGNRAARKTARDLERFHRVVEAVQSGFEGTMPVRVVLFGSARDYNRFRWAKSGGKMAYYLPGRKHDYIVLHNSRQVHAMAALPSRTGSSTGHIVLRDRKQTLFHEYVHLVQHQTTASLPLWLEEGVAELYSSVQTGRDTVRIGKPITGHVLTLRDEPLLDFETLLAVNEDSPIYSDGKGAWVFYAQSWAFAHMLRLSERYSGRFDDFVAALGRGDPQPAAFQSVFEKPIEQGERDLAAYLRRLQLRQIEVPIGDAASKQKVEPVALSRSEARLFQVDLLLELGYVADAKEMIAPLVEDGPAADVGVRAGELALRLLDYEDARSRFARALELGADTARVHFGYAQALDETGGDRQEVWRRLRRALDLDGGFPEALLFTGMLHSRELRYGDAVAPLERASRARPRWSPIWRALAFAYLHAHKPAEASRAIGLALRTAQTPHQRRETEWILTTMSPKVSSDP